MVLPAKTGWFISSFKALAIKGSRKAIRKASFFLHFVIFSSAYLFYC